MLIPVVIFIACLSAGVAAGARWLPDLAAGSVGGLAFFAVCGLLGAAAAVVGLRVYSIVNALENLGTFRGFDKGEIVAAGVRDMLWEAGSLLGLAIVAYLLAPPPPEATEDPEPGPVA